MRHLHHVLVLVLLLMLCTACSYEGRYRMAHALRRASTQGGPSRITVCTDTSTKNMVHIRCGTY